MHHWHGVKSRSVTHATTLLRYRGRSEKNICKYFSESLENVPESLVRARSLGNLIK